jgi:outer membrane lipoprotein
MRQRRTTSVRSCAGAGRIVQTLPRDDSTCFEVLATPLDSSARPHYNSDTDDGRFIACRNGFYDPAVFEPNREITLTGRIEAYDTRKIGGFDYRFPRVAADVVYLWPIRERVDRADVSAAVAVVGLLVIFWGRR